MLAKGTGVDLLCYVPIVEIEAKAIPYLIATLVPLNPDPAWNEKCAVFWEYFRRTWLILYSPELWNIYRFRNDWDKIQNRTNNALERYNRVMNEKIPAGKPSMPKFIDGIKELSLDQLKKLEDIKQKRINPANRNEMAFYYPPSEYDRFNPNLLAEEDYENDL